MRNDKRRFHRLEFNSPIRMISDTKTTQEQVVNISANGCAVLSRTTRELGEQLRLKIWTKNNQWIDVNGRITRADTQPYRPPRKKDDKDVSRYYCHNCNWYGLLFPGNEEATLFCPECGITKLAPYQINTYLLGIEFINLNSEQREDILRLVEVMATEEKGPGERKSPRIDLLFQPAHIIHAQGSQTSKSKCYIKDISRGGICLLTELDLEPMTEITLEMVLQENKRQELRGVIIQTRKKQWRGKNCFLYGLKFVELDGEKQQELVDFIAELTLKQILYDRVKTKATTPLPPCTKKMATVKVAAISCALIFLLAVIIVVILNYS